MQTNGLVFGRRVRPPSVLVMKNRQASNAFRCNAQGRFRLTLILSFLALVASACALPLEEHGGAAPRPEANDLVFMGGGAALNESLILARVPWQARVAADAAAIWVLRFPQWGGRNEGVSVTIPFGAFVPEMARFIVVAKRRPVCQYAGADGVVHQGHLSHEECT